MPGTVVGKSLNLGYAGKVTRNGLKEIGARFVKSILDGSGVETLSAIPFGAPTVLNTDNTYSLFGQAGSGVSAATVALFGGFAVAEVKPVYTYLTNSAGEYSPNQSADVMQKGSIMVTVKDTTASVPTAGGQVYIVTALNSNSVFSVGDMVASATPTGYTTGGTATLAALTGVKFTTGKIQITSGVIAITEVTIQTQVNV